MSERDVEWRFLRVGLAGLLAVLALDVSGWGVWRIVHPPPTKFELTVRCLKNEKGLPVSPARRDPIASSADDGSLVTTVEGNHVTVAMATSDERAERIENDYRSVGAEANRLERRGRTVYLWALPSSPTQRQTLYDCAY